MLQNTEDESSKDVVGSDQVSSSSMPTSPNHNSSRPNSMVIKKTNVVIPAHLVAEAISSLHGLDLRWSGPITPTEMQYVEQYIFAKYPEYSNGLVNVDHDNNHEKKSVHDMSRVQLLEPSKLVDVLAKKTSPRRNFISIPEIQARDRALQSCGLSDRDYCVVFMQGAREAMVMVGEAYPFCRGNYYMTVLNDEDVVIKDMATCKESRVVPTPVAWLDLRIKGSQLSQYFRRKCKQVPKGLFAYPACHGGYRSSMHWISEAHRNAWHVLLDATRLEGEDHLALAIHRPDFVVCTVDVIRMGPAKVTCLLVRKSSFDIANSVS